MNLTRNVIVRLLLAVAAVCAVGAVVTCVVGSLAWPALGAAALSSLGIAFVIHKAEIT